MGAFHTSHFKFKLDKIINMKNITELAREWETWPTFFSIPNYNVSINILQMQVSVVMR